MRRRNQDFQVTILSTICLSLLIFFLLSVCTRLLRVISRTFVYLTGLVSLFLIVLVTILAIIAVIYFITCGKRKCHRIRIGKRRYFNLSRVILETQVLVVGILIFISILLIIICRFIY